MSLPRPTLDDRSFQELVDEAKRMVQRKWPQWTGWDNHNVSDPGVTMIETFAFMVDQLIYRMNRLPELTQLQLLELLGIGLHPPVSARVPVTFYLSSRVPEDVLVPEDTEVSTERTSTRRAVVFRTTEPLPIVATEITEIAVESGGAITPSDALDTRQSVRIFGDSPEPGDAFYVGLDRPAPGCIVSVEFSGDVAADGINPESPPRRWEASVLGDDGRRTWESCPIERDETRGFNTSGGVVIHIPRGHVSSSVGGATAGWLRCVVEPEGEHTGRYLASPEARSVAVATVGGTVEAMHSQQVRDEYLGVCEGVAGQRFELSRVPVAESPEPEEILEYATGGSNGTGPNGRVAVRTWYRVERFGVPEEHDGNQFVLDPNSGLVRFPPALREEDGTMRLLGSVPDPGNELRIRSYRAGGGVEGNVIAGSIRFIRSPIRHVGRVTNRVDAAGGVDGEMLDSAAERGPLLLTSRDRAVTRGDFEYLARMAGADIARAVVARTPNPGADVTLLLVPELPDEPDALHRPTYDQLRLRPEPAQRVQDHIEQRRIVGVVVTYGEPGYQGIRAAVQLVRRRLSRNDDVRRLATDALYRYFHPIVGGPDGTGWPLGRPAQVSDVHSVVSAVPGVDYVRSAQLYPYDVHTDTLVEEPATTLRIGPSDLVLSHGHSVVVLDPDTDLP